MTTPTPEPVAAAFVGASAPCQNGIRVVRSWLQATCRASPSVGRFKTHNLALFYRRSCSLLHNGSDGRSFDRASVIQSVSTPHLSRRLQTVCVMRLALLTRCRRMSMLTSFSPTRCANNRTYFFTRWIPIFCLTPPDFF